MVKINSVMCNLILATAATFGCAQENISDKSTKEDRLEIREYERQNIRRSATQRNLENVLLGYFSVGSQGIYNTKNGKLGSRHHLNHRRIYSDDYFLQNFLTYRSLEDESDLIKLQVTFGKEYEFNDDDKSIPFGALSLAYYDGNIDPFLLIGYCYERENFATSLSYERPILLNEKGTVNSEIEIDWEVLKSNIETKISVENHKDISNEVSLLFPFKLMESAPVNLIISYRIDRLSGETCRSTLIGLAYGRAPHNSVLHQFEPISNADDIPWIRERKKEEGRHDMGNNNKYKGKGSGGDKNNGNWNH